MPTCAVARRAGKPTLARRPSVSFSFLHISKTNHSEVHSINRRPAATENRRWVPIGSRWSSHKGARRPWAILRRSALRLATSVPESANGWRTALGCHCRGADCASRSSIIPAAAQARGADASELDEQSVPALVECRGPAAAGRRRGCGAETGVRALPRCRAGVPDPADVAGSRGTGAVAVVRCEPGPAHRARWLPPLSGFIWVALPPSRA